jgi:outer membrane protein assembly factor BamB
MRPQCHVGVVVGNGHLYWAPWACDCNLQMFGVISVGPAGEFKFDQPATEAERLETAADAAKVAPLASSPDDWPAYRADNARSARTQAAVPDAVALLWQFAPPRPVEPTAPVAAGGLVMVAGSDGLVRALDAATGRPRWTAYTGGAVRYPPAVADGRAFVGSGDGWAYALEAATGRLLWRFRASPVPRKIVLYGTLLDTWPVAAGVLVDRGTAYLAAGINNFDGTHVYALDAATGRLKWQNNTCGHLDAFSRRGVAVQGDLLLADGKLYLAGGDAVSPAIFNVDDGTCQNPPPNAPGSQALRGRELTLASGTVTVSGQPFYSRPEAPVYDKSVKWETPVVTAKNAQVSFIEQKDEKGAAWSLVARDPAGGAERWSQPLPDAPVRWGIAVDAQGRILVTLRSGKVMCFGAK